MRFLESTQFFWNRKKKRIEKNKFFLEKNDFENFHFRTKIWKFLKIFDLLKKYIEKKSSNFSIFKNRIYLRNIKDFENFRKWKFSKSFFSKKKKFFRISSDSHPECILLNIDYNFYDRGSPNSIRKNSASLARKSIFRKTCEIPVWLVQESSQIARKVTQGAFFNFGVYRSPTHSRKHSGCAKSKV